MGCWHYEMQRLWDAEVMHVKKINVRLSVYPMLRCHRLLGYAATPLLYFQAMQWSRYVHFLGYPTLFGRPTSEGHPSPRICFIRHGSLRLQASGESWSDNNMAMFFLSSKLSRIQGQRWETVVHCLLWTRESLIWFLSLCLIVSLKIRSMTLSVVDSWVISYIRRHCPHYYVDDVIGTSNHLNDMTTTHIGVMTML